ncbi:MAG TPA: hypothetical protein DE315_05975 [Candidatus Omnitrophica bacterium]|nr:MAG: hypothetical protein A2Y05_02130 [Omnitrophica WOR_2 bacterium GWA2_53_43]HCI45057.1 hypothetical protein [Candidatus Omnitrophota bacterium]
MLNEDASRQLALKVINKEKWWDVLSRFIDVLHINIFIVDRKGLTILPPEEGKYGGRLLTDRSLGFRPAQEASEFLKKFEQYGSYLEYASPLNLHQFAIPININGEGGLLGYMIVGPVILNKRLGNAEYAALARERNIPAQDLVNEVNGLRVVSNVMINSILDLLSEIVKNNIELSGIKSEMRQQGEGEEGFSEEIKEAAKDLYSTVCLDELLVTLLDVALKMTNTECGSIMVVDQERQGDLTIKVSRGLKESRIKNTRVRIGEGIAGLAAKENRPFVIHGQQAGDNRIKPFLQRPEIQHSLIMPLMAKRRIFGVLNLHTREAHCNIENNIENLQYLSNLLSSVV